MLSQVQDDYNGKLQALRGDKELIKEKTEQFQALLMGLQEQLTSKQEEVTELRGELDEAYQKMGELQEQLQNDLVDKSMLAQSSEEAYNAGRREAEDELSLENTKLREMIEGLHSEVSAKTKLIAEANFRVADLEKQMIRVKNNVS